MVKEIKHGDKVFATFYSHVETDSIEFLTPKEYPIQIGLIQHKEGKEVEAHFHNDFDYPVTKTHEILLVEEGEIEITITDLNWEPIHTEHMKKGDVALLMDGGHSVSCKKGSRVWEFKQGPYPGDAKAKVFKSSWNGPIPEDKHI